MELAAARKSSLWYYIPYIIFQKASRVIRCVVYPHDGPVRWRKSQSLNAWNAQTVSSHIDKENSEKKRRQSERNIPTQRWLTPGSLKKCGGSKINQKHTHPTFPFSAAGGGSTMSPFPQGRYSVYLPFLRTPDNTATIKTLYKHVLRRHFLWESTTISTAVHCGMAQGNNA